ncbi:MAG: hypothetical protein HY320_04910 [Armatimonadetes bacterium]|nr:hypothetical protein [Armatimonadota bacterium]
MDATLRGAAIRDALRDLSGVPLDKVDQSVEARVVTFRIPGHQPVPPVIAFFTAEKLLEPGQPPEMMLNAQPSEPAFPGVRPGMEAAVFRIRDGMLVISLLPDTPRGPTRVCVVELRGKILPATALLVGLPLADVLEARLISSRHPPVFPGARLMQSIRVDGARIPQIADAIRNTAGIPPDLKNQALALLNQANAVQVGQYMLPVQARSAPVLQFYRTQAEQRKWTVLKEDAVRPERASALYQLPENQGVVMLLMEVRVEPPNPRNPLGGRIPQVTLLQLEGAVNIEPPPAPPPTGPPPPDSP